MTLVTEETENHWKIRRKFSQYLLIYHTHDVNILFLLQVLLYKIMLDPSKQFLTAVTTAGAYDKVRYKLHIHVHFIKPLMFTIVAH
jgi:hypothetical protein